MKTRILLWGVFAAVVLLAACLLFKSWIEGEPARVLEKASPELRALSVQVFSARLSPEALADLDDPAAPAVILSFDAKERERSSSGVSSYMGTPYDRFGFWLLDVVTRLESLFSRGSASVSAQIGLPYGEHVDAREQSRFSLLCDFNTPDAKKQIAKMLASGLTVSNFSCQPPSFSDSLAERAKNGSFGRDNPSNFFLSSCLAPREALERWLAAPKPEKGSDDFRLMALRPETLACASGSLERLDALLLNPALKTRAVSALGCFQGEAARSRLETLAKDPSPQVREHVCEAVERRADADDIPILRSLLADKSGGVQAEAVCAAISVGLPISRTDFLTAVRNKSWRLHRFDARTLEKVLDSVGLKGEEREEALWTISGGSRSRLFPASELLAKNWSPRLLDYAEAMSDEQRLAKLQIVRVIVFCADTPERKADALRRFGPFLRSVKISAFEICESSTLDPLGRRIMLSKQFSPEALLIRLGDFSKFDESFSKKPLESLPRDVVKELLLNGRRDAWAALLRLAEMNVDDLVNLPAALPDENEAPALRAELLEEAKRVLTPRFDEFARSCDVQAPMPWSWRAGNALSLAGVVGDSSLARKVLRGPSLSVSAKDAALKALGEAGDPESFDLVVEFLDKARSGVDPRFHWPQSRMIAAFEALAALCRKTQPEDPLREKALAQFRRSLDSASLSERQAAARGLMGFPEDARASDLLRSVIEARRDPASMMAADLHLRKLERPEFILQL